MVFSLSVVIPVVVLLTTTALNIAGNLVKAFSYSDSGFFVTIYLWKGEFCSSATGCIKISHSELGSGTCDFKNQYRAAQAFGILACLMSGLMLLVCAANAASVFGPITARNVQLQTLGALVLIGIEVLAFILFATVKNLECLSSKNASYEAAPFLFLACIVLAIVYLSWTVFTNAAENSGSAVQTNNNPPGRPSQSQQRGEVEQSPPNKDSNKASAAAHHGGASSPLANAVVAATSAPHVAVSVEQEHDATRQRPTLAPTSTEEVAVPEGDDWVFDSNTGLSWSEKMKLFFDPASAQFYDPGSELWYDPSVGRWHQITQ